ncbi:hypothetical protein HYS49_01610 [Candidatus Woesearchaeota archaeon]|nr:hypothetical protein [Candidatus Woesearchaeota archaeon]
MASEEEIKDLVYLIERCTPDFYDVDVAKRLVSAEEMAERIAEEMRTAQPLTPEELRMLEEGGFSHAQDYTQPSAWNAWLSYERLDGTYVNLPLSSHPTVEAMGRSVALLRVQGLLEEKLEQFEQSVGSIVNACKALGVLESDDEDEPVLSLELEFY